MPEGDEASAQVDASQNDSTTDDAKQSPPWEKRGELGPDWVGTDEDPWAGPRDGDDGEAR